METVRQNSVCCVTPQCFAKLSLGGVCEVATWPVTLSLHCCYSCTDACCNLTTVNKEEGEQKQFPFIALWLAVSDLMCGITST